MKWKDTNYVTRSTGQIIIWTRYLEEDQYYIANVGTEWSEANKRNYPSFTTLQGDDIYYQTVYKYIESLTSATVNIAISLAGNGSLPYSQTTINNGKIMVPAIQLSNMIQVTKENMRMTVIADGYLDEKVVFGGI